MARNRKTDYHKSWWKRKKRRSSVPVWRFWWLSWRAVGILLLLLCECESQLILLKKDTEEHESMCTAAIEKMMNQVEKRVHELNIMEQEAEKFVNDSELKLQHAISEGEEETQMCAGELVALIDSVSEYKEHMESLICGMQVGLSETAQAVTEVHKAHLSQRLSSLSCASLSGSKRSHFLLES